MKMRLKNAALDPLNFYQFSKPISKELHKDKKKLMAFQINRFPTTHTLQMEKNT